MRCKDCVHCNVCGFSKELGLDQAEKMFDFKCVDFRNRADFENVIRCKDCKFAIKVDRVYLCEKTGKYMKFSDYCSYGKRKEK